MRPAVRGGGVPVHHPGGRHQREGEGARGVAIEPVGLNPGSVATAWGDRIARAHVERRAVAAGTRLRVGEATLAELLQTANDRIYRHALDDPAAAGMGTVVTALLG